MSLLNRLLRMTMAFSLIASSALADIPQELQTVILEGNLYGRSSVDFRKKARNVTSLIPQGTQGTVLETRKLSRTGSYGVKIRITQVSKNLGSTTAKENDEVWVYYSQKDPWLSFQDKAGSDIQDPEEALSSTAKRDGVGLPAEGTVPNPTLPTKKEIKEREAQRERELAEAEAKRRAEALKTVDPNLAMNKDKTKTEGGFTEVCTTCQTGTVADKNVKDLSAVSKEAEKPAKLSDPNDPWADDPYISKYSHSKKVEKAIRAAKKSASRSKRLCYRYVKNALLAGDLIDSYPPGGKAKQGVSDLKAQGMVNLLDNPKYASRIRTPADAPKGAVLVYSTGESKEAGHIEIKTGDGKNATYVSDYQSAKNIQQTTKGIYKARIGKPYKIIGVMILPPGKL
ncbi:hypothetical protein [Bdellovibrio svalbardensis]|uniref:Uncharacterized protein n=1 Tax=Bdellovibrio svalbardensis TaxID=2972972 RepID=A0ABT6DMR5_9BACT|nr:hypothetical protein [Bdellovibrio svalbardensis]MDG0817941.1 hypothetical protein [Bdellovibrio svalbardensis]